MGRGEDFKEKDLSVLKKKKKKCCAGSSLAVQGLGLGTSPVAVQVQSLVRELRSHIKHQASACRSQKKKKMKTMMCLPLATGAAESHQVPSTAPATIPRTGSATIPGSPPHKAVSDHI